MLRTLASIEEAPDRARQNAVGITAWLDSYRRSRDDNDSMLRRIGRRLAEELRESGAAEKGSPSGADAAAAAPTRPPKKKRELPLGRMLSSVWHQRRRLRSIARSEPNGHDNLLIVSDTMRLPAWRSRREVRDAVRPIFETQNYRELFGSIDRAGRVLLFSPNFAAAGNGLSEGEVEIVDYPGLAAVALLWPLATAAAVLRAVRGSLVKVLRDPRALLLTVTAAVMRVLIERLRIGELLFMTSNSYAVELLRWTAIENPLCRRVIEILHGVPTLELERHYAEMFSAVGPGRAAKMVFVATAPALPVHAISPPEVQITDFAINSNLNRYRAGRSFEEALEGALRSRAGPRGYRVSINGATIDPEPFFESAYFHAERLLIETVREYATTARLPFEIVYSVHPAHRKSGLAAQFHDQMRVDALIDDSVDTWLTSDLCVSILSSSNWDAQFLGCETFLGVGESDDIFSLALLEGGAYVARRQTTPEALCQALAKMTSREPISQTEIASRVHRLYDRRTVG